MTEKQSLVERVARAMYADLPLRAITPALREQTGLPADAPVSWEQVLEMGGNHDGLIRLARAALLAILPPELRELSRKGTAGPWAWKGEPGHGAPLYGLAGEQIIDHASYEGMWFAAYNEAKDIANAQLLAAAVNFIREIEEGRDG